MRKIVLFLALVLACTYSFQGSSNFKSESVGKTSFYDNHVNDLYTSLNAKGLDLHVLAKALKGYYKLKGENKLKTNLLTVVDFTKSSKESRLFIINVEDQKVIHSSLVSHGRGSGDDFATKFSNIHNSYQSSLGFYLTGETYNGAHGISLRLDGLEKGFNDNARARGIVIHSADYVSYEFAKKVGRLGRSHGCPALPVEGYSEIIDLVKNKSLFFIYYPDKNYLTKSEYINNVDYLNYFIDTKAFAFSE